MKERLSEEEVYQKRKRSLLERYDIPIEHLDFTYINNCDDAREVEKILKILRSGEEGYFPELEKCVASKLETLNPRSRALRVETPILRSHCLDKNELEDLQKSFLDWVDEVEDKNKIDRLAYESGDTRQIFPENFHSDVPIRSEIITVSENGRKNDKKVEEKAFIQPANPHRIKSWEYEKWEKFDVDTELTKLDIESAQAQEKCLDVKKLKEEQEIVAKCMKNLDLEGNQWAQGKAKSSIKDKSFVGEAVTEIDDIPDLEEDVDNDRLFHIQNIRRDAKKSEILDVPSSSRYSPQLIIDNNGSNSTRLCKNNYSNANSNNTIGKSFIEEIPEEKVATKPESSHRKCNNSAAPNNDAKPKRRFKIQIQDLNVR